MSVQCALAQETLLCVCVCVCVCEKEQMHILVEQAPELVAHVDHHHLFTTGGQVGDLELDVLSHRGVDGSTETTVRGHTDEQMLGLVLGGLDLGLFIQGCAKKNNITSP